MYHEGGRLGIGAAAGMGTVMDQNEVAEKMRAAREWEQQQKAGLMNDSKLRDRGVLEVSLDSVANGMDEAFAALDRLASRLQLVMQPEIPTPMNAAGSAQNTETHSPVVSRLHGMRQQLEVLTCRINALSARLET